MSFLRSNSLALPWMALRANLILVLLSQTFSLTLCLVLAFQRWKSSTDPLLNMSSSKTSRLALIGMYILVRVLAESFEISTRLGRVSGKLRLLLVIPFLNMFLIPGSVRSSNQASFGRDSSSGLQVSDFGFEGDGI